ncbi:MAG: VCBS repeat-containing protein [Myxococcota bacterium]
MSGDSNAGSLGQLDEDAQRELWLLSDNALAAFDFAATSWSEVYDAGRDVRSFLVSELTPEDGREDVLWSDSSGQVMLVSGATLTSRAIDIERRDGQQWISDDMDGDGVDEVIILDGRTVTLVDLRNLDVPARSSVDLGAAEPNGLVVSDLNFDGVRDIVLISRDRVRAVLVSKTASDTLQLSFVGTFQDFSPLVDSSDDLGFDRRLGVGWAGQLSPLGPTDLVLSLAGTAQGEMLRLARPRSPVPRLALSEFVSVSRSIERIVGSADLNLDGLPDIVASEGRVNEEAGLLVILSDTATEWSEPMEIDQRPGEFLLEDADGDGLADIWVLEQLGTAAVYFGTDQGQLEREVRPDLDRDIRCTGDFNGDGQRDLVKSVNAGWVVQLSEPCGGRWCLGANSEPLRPFQFGISDCLASDLDGDGDEDLVIADRQEVDAFVNEGSAQFTRQTTRTLTQNTRLVGVADFNLDGWPDVVTASNPERIYFGDSSPNNRELIGDSFISLTNDVLVGDGSIGTALFETIVDWNGDGRPDLVSTQQVLINENDGTSFSLVELSPGRDVASQVFADIDDDGRLDAWQRRTVDGPFTSSVLGFALGSWDRQTPRAIPVELPTAPEDVDGFSRPFQPTVTITLEQEPASVLSGLRQTFVLGRATSLTALWRLDGDRRLIGTANPFESQPAEPRTRVVSRLGALGPDGVSRTGLGSQAGVVVDIPVIEGVSAADVRPEDVRVFVLSPEWLRASDVQADPASDLPDADQYLPLLQNGEGFREISRRLDQWVEVPRAVGELTQSVPSFELLVEDEQVSAVRLIVRRLGRVKAVVTR